MSSDHLGDVADRDALVGDRVQRRSGWRLLQREAERRAESSRCAAGQRLVPSAM
jgi:hypothetical protein